MNEMNETSGNQLKKFLNALNTIGMVEDIAHLVFTKASGTISIAFPKDPRRQDEMHFLTGMESNNQFDSTELTTAIKEKLGYDYTAEDGAEIIIHPQRLFDKGAINDLYVEVVQLSRENFKNINSFITRYYPQFFGLTENTKEASTTTPSQFWNQPRTDVEKTPSKYINTPAPLSKEQLLADKLFAANADKIRSLSPPEKRN